jgi:Protein of unknown function (DUF2911)
MEHNRLHQPIRNLNVTRASREASMKNRVALIATIILFLATISSAQMGGGRPSPPASATCDLGGGKTIKTDYSSPRMKGRKIFGGLVPYGEVWRTGANDATTFVTSADISIGGKNVPAGSYTIFTVPKPDSWTLIINKKTGEWGIPYKYESDELARIDMRASKLPSPIENFTISYSKTASGCTMQIEWETTEVSVGIVAK